MPCRTGHALFKLTILLIILSNTSEMEDLYQIPTYLKDLTSQHICDLGLALGLKYPNLKKMDNVPHDMVAAWLRQEDMVPTNPPTWTTLASALESIGQTGIALNIRTKFCQYQSTAV